jgi:predicted DNA-binding antitoxin AbrB/MazE fold protein
MQETIKAVYENGMLRPLQPLNWLRDKSEVVVTVSAEEARPPWTACVGLISDKDASAMIAAIADAFEQVESDEWE